MGYRRVALVGSDLPHLPAVRYAEAFAALDRADTVIGPSGDGGYYLLAAERETPALFENITWSTEIVYRQTLDRAAAAGLRVAEIAPCDDVDTAEDLTFLLDALRQYPGAGYTLRLLERLPVINLTPNPLPCEERGLASSTMIDRAVRSQDGRGGIGVSTTLHRAEAPSLAGEGPVSEASGERSIPCGERFRP
jgi:hypothetical protein